MTKLKGGIRAVLSMLLICSCFSCNKNVVYKDLHVFDGEVWSDSDTAVFNYFAEDTIGWYNVILNLRTSKNYGFSNLWIYFIIETPNSNRSVVAHQIPVALPDGSWIGKEKGNKVESQLKLSAFQFPEKGNYTFKIIQSTQEAEIPNVNSIIFSIFQSDGK